MSSMAIHRDAQSIPATRKHIPALDGVRGVAVLLVLVHHLAQSLSHYLPVEGPGWWLAFFQWGWTGVDLFFVLSGFLITGILLDSRSHPHYLRNFYVRRALRIMPLYVIAVLFFSTLSVLFPHPVLYGDGTSRIWLWTYLTNVVIARQGFGVFGLVDHFWSLAIEEQYYLVWPFVVLLFAAGRLIPLLAAACGLVLLARLAALFDGQPSFTIYTLTIFRFDALALGSLVAVITNQKGIDALVPHAKRIGIAAVSALLAFALWRGRFVHDDPAVLGAGFSVIAVTFACLIVLAVASRPWTQFLSLPQLRWFGKYSYGLYVWHPLAFVFIFHTETGSALWKDYGLAGLVSAAVLASAGAIALTLTSWHLVEKRCLALKRFFEYEDVPVRSVPGAGTGTHEVKIAP